MKKDIRYREADFKTHGLTYWKYLYNGNNKKKNELIYVEDNGPSEIVFFI